VSEERPEIGDRLFIGPCLNGGRPFKTGPLGPGAWAVYCVDGGDLSQPATIEDSLEAAVIFAAAGLARLLCGDELKRT